METNTRKKTLQEAYLKDLSQHLFDAFQKAPLQEPEAIVSAKVS